MRRPFLYSAAGLALLWTAALWMQYGQGRPGGRVLALGLARKPGAAPAERRAVTPGQLTASGAMTNRALGDFTAVAHDGRRLGWTQLSGGRPVVLIFIKRECPCSVEFQPFFSRLERAYRGRARFAAVIDAPVPEARAWAQGNRVSYPLVADPGQQIIARFRARHSAYVALLTRDGVLATLWPGCSVDMMRELSSRVARMAGVPEQRVDFTGMPRALTTGCPFSSSGPPLRSGAREE
jgi:peroxiredoxin